MPDKKLLVADDSLTIQKVIRLALSNEGYEIQTVSNGVDAIQQIATFRPHVVLIDISLPKKAAFEVKKEINQHSDLSQVHFVLMSSAFEKIDETQMKEARFHGSLSKPFDPAHLRSVLGSVFGQAQSSPSPPEIPSPIEPTGGTIAPSFSSESSRVDSPQVTQEIWNKDIKSFPPPVPFQNPMKESETLIPKPQDFSPKGSSKTSSFSLPPVKLPSSTSSEIQSQLTQFKPKEATNSSEKLGKTSDQKSIQPLFEEENSELSQDLNGELDIQKLTESTMKFETTDFDWKVNETSLSSSPPSFPSSKEVTSSFDTPPQFSPPEEMQTPPTKLPAPESKESLSEFPPSLPADFQDNSSQEMSFQDPPSLSKVVLPLDKDLSYEIQSTVHPTADASHERKELNEAYPSDPSRISIAPSPQEMDRKIHEAVEAHLREIVTKLLPDLAERLIKEEIHRMLNET